MKLKKLKKIKKIKNFFRATWLLKFLGLRQTKYGTNTLVAILALAGILILINFIVQKENVRWDVTKIKKYTLSDQTKNILRQVKDEIKIIAFYSNDDPQKETAFDLLSEYKSENNKIKIEFIDPDEKPQLARQYGIDRYETIVFEMGDRKEQTIGFTESGVTSSILKLIKKEEKKIYFLEGHGEKNIDDFKQEGYSQIKSSLQKEGYKVEKLALFTKPEIPSDISLLVIASPKKPFLDEEKKAVEKYLDEGGRSLILFDPQEEEKDLGLSQILDKWGVEAKRGFVIDPKRFFWTDVGSPAISSWVSHQITAKLSTVFFPGVSLIRPKDTIPENVTVISLAETSEDSWLEQDLDKKKEVKFDEDKDIKGPVSIAVVVQKETEKKEESEEKEKSKTRLVVIGDSDFAQNSFAQALANQDLFLNSVNWLVEEEELISIRPKEEESRRVVLTGNQARLIFLICVVFMPLAVVALGIYVWVSRRRKRKK